MSQDLQNVQWNQPYLRTCFANLLRQNRFCDVTLACDNGETLMAHRAILCSCSEYFSRVFCSVEKDAVVILKDCNYDDVKLIIQFIYNGEINVEQERIPSLQRIAESFKMKGLIEAFTTFTLKLERDAGASTSAIGETPNQEGSKRSASPARLKHGIPTKIPHLSQNTIEKIFLPPPSQDNTDLRRTTADDTATLRKFRQTFDASNQPKLFEILARIETKLDTLGRSSIQPVPPAISAATPQVNLKPSPQRLKPITTVEELDDLENKLCDEGYWNAVFDAMKTICGANANMQGYDCCYALVDQFFTREFLNTCSWTGGSRSPDMKKTAFKTYKRAIHIFYELVHLADPTFSEINTEKFFHSVLRNSRQRALHGASDRPKRTSKMRRRLGAANSYHHDHQEYTQAFLPSDTVYSIDEFSEEEQLSGENIEDTKVGLLDMADDNKTDLLGISDAYGGLVPTAPEEDEQQPAPNFSWIAGDGFANQY